jgi:hypothetical protein
LLGRRLGRFNTDSNRNRAGIFAFVAFSDGKPVSTFPENALFAFVAFSDGKPDSTPDRAGGMLFLKML